jgi:mono/diheme cytochrome c family protein
MNLALFLIVFCTLTAAAQDEINITSDSRDGKLMYDAWCARCHGNDGKGPADGVELDTPVPDFTDCSFTSREPRKDWLAVILHGGPARGLSMTMPSWGEAISEDQAEAIITHIKTFCTEPDWPEGELNFRRAQVTGKAFPENEILIIPSFTSSGSPSSTSTLVYESRVGRTGQWEVAVPLVTRTGGTGLGDIELAGKYALWYDTGSLSILSVGVEMVLPTGSTASNFGGGTMKLAPFVAAAKGAGNTFLQSSIKLERPLRAGHSSELQYDLAWTVPLTSEKRGIHPIIEIHGITDLSHSSTTFFVTPQVYVALPKRGHVAVSLGAQIPLGPQKPFDYRILGFFLWEYADGGIWW